MVIKKGQLVILTKGYEDTASGLYQCLKEFDSKKMARNFNRRKKHMHINDRLMELETKGYIKNIDAEIANITDEL